jgi:hypothetical protein
MTMKKILKWTGIGAGILLLLAIIVALVFISRLDKDQVADLLESKLNRRVTMGDMNVKLFSSVSRIETTDVVISNAVDEARREEIESSPIPQDDVFVSAEKMQFHFSILPLLKGKFVVKTLTFEKPEIYIVRNSDGTFNYSDLAEPGPPSDKPAKIPLELSVHEAGFRNAAIHYRDPASGFKLTVYDFDGRVTNLQIDPGNLDEKNSLDVELSLGLKTAPDSRSDAVESFDLAFAMTGQVQPFDRDTREIAPSARLHAETPSGRFSGLRIYQALQSVEVIKPYVGGLDFLGDQLFWKDGAVDITYRDGVVGFENGEMKSADYSLSLDGTFDMESSQVDVQSELILSAEHSEAVTTKIRSNIRALINRSLKLKLPEEEFVNSLIESMTGEDGRVHLLFDVSGRASKPSVGLKSPSLPNLSDVLRQGAAETVKSQAKSLIQKLKKKIR